VPRREVVTAVRVPVALVATPPGGAERLADLDRAAVHPANQIQINSEGEPVSAGPMARLATAESRQVSAVHPANQIQINSTREPPPEHTRSPCGPGEAAGPRPRGGTERSAPSDPSHRRPALQRA